MAVSTPTSLIANFSASDATSYTTASISTVTGRLYLLGFYSRTGISANPNQPTATGTGLSFIVPTNGTVITDQTSSSRRRLTAMYAIATVTGSTTIVIDEGGQTQTAGVWSVVEIASGFDASTSVRQAANNQNQSLNTGITATLADFYDANSITIGFGCHSTPSNTISVGSGFTQLSQTAESTEASLLLMTEYKMSNDTTVDMSYSSSEGEVGIIGLEVKAIPTVTTNYLNGRARKRIKMTGVSAG